MIYYYIVLRYCRRRKEVLLFYYNSTERNGKQIPFIEGYSELDGHFEPQSEHYNSCRAVPEDKKQEAEELYNWYIKYYHFEGEIPILSRRLRKMKFINN